MLTMQFMDVMDMILMGVDYGLVNKLIDVLTNFLSLISYKDVIFCVII